MVDHAQIRNRNWWLIADKFLGKSDLINIVDLNRLGKVQLEILNCVVHSPVKVGQELLTLVGHSHIN